MGHIQLNEIGWTSRVYIVDDGKFVVKFPRSEKVKKEYIQELKIHKLLERVVSDVQVPKLRWTHPDNDYLGYEGIQGIEFDKVAKTLEPELQAQIGASLGSFVNQLHSLRLDDPHVMTVEDEIMQFQSKYAAALPVIMDTFTRTEQTRT